MSGIHRRKTLGLLGAGMTFLAGCSESSTDDPAAESDTESTADSDGDSSDGSDDGADESIDADGDLPSYASMLPDTDQPTYFYGAIEFDTALFDDDTEGGDTTSDPLLLNPLAVAMLSTFGIDQLRDIDAASVFADHGDLSDDSDSVFVYVDGAYAITGTYDREAFAADLEASGYAAETDADDYAVFAHEDGDEAVGVADDVFAYSFPTSSEGESESESDPITAVERTVATAAGQRTAKHEADEDFERLLRAGETDGISLCLHTDDDAFADGTLTADRTDEGDGFASQFEAFEGSNGVFQQLSADGGSASASAVVAYSGDDRVDVDRLESSLGTDANTVDVRRDGTAVAIDADYSGELGDG